MSFAIGHSLDKQDAIWHALGSSDYVWLQSEGVSDVVWHALGVVDGVRMQSEPRLVVEWLSIGGCAVFVEEDSSWFASVQSLLSLLSRAIFLPGKRKICQDCEFFAGEAIVSPSNENSYVRPNDCCYFIIKVKYWCLCSLCEKFLSRCSLYRHCLVVLYSCRDAKYLPRLRVFCRGSYCIT